MSQPLWTSKEIAKATGGAVKGGNWSVDGISIDTRELAKDDLFIALQAERDGHTFCKAAIKAGAGGLLVSRSDIEGPCVRVADTQKAMEALGKAGRKRSDATRIAITGSVGKTSLKEALGVMLDDTGSTHRSVKSFNNQWGVPITLARMPQQTRFGIFEIGTNHPGEIAPLSAQIKPHIGLITHIAAAHLAGFGSIKDIAREKASLWAALAKEGTAIMPADLPVSELLRKQASYFDVPHILEFGRSENCDVRITDWQTDPNGSHGSFDIHGQTVKLSTKVVGMHWADLIAVCLATALACELDLDAAAKAMKNVEVPAGRGRLLQLPVKGGFFTLMDDSYNANPASMKAALDTLGRFNGGRKLAVLGEMLELGPDGPQLHGELAWPIEKAGVEQVFCVGQQMRELHRKLPCHRQAGWFAEPGGIAQDLYEQLRSGDIVLIKGSNGSGVHRIADQLREIAQMETR
jgi:UDP-N-acetylmuramoyl-tripeptide--D-alanyl-D-alanine ligase